MNEQKAVTEFDKGNQLLQDGKLEDAIAAYCCAIELNPTNSWFHHHLGEALGQMERFDEAVTAYRHAIELNPDFCWSYHHLGDALTQQQHWEESATAFRQAIELNPEHYGTYVGLGKSLAKLGQLDEAIAAYRRASELNPDADWIHHALANVLQQQKQSNLAEAIASYRQMIELNPDNVEAYQNLLQVQPDNSDTWLQLAQAFVRQEQMEEAIAAYRRAIELNPSSSQAYHELGSVLAYEEKLEEALVVYQRAVEFAPDLAQTYYLLGESHAQLGEIEAASRSYRRAFDITPDYCHKSFLHDLEERTHFRVNAEQLCLVPSQQIITESLPKKITSLKSNQGWVFYGPYLNLTDGLYRVQVDFEFPEQASGLDANPETVGFKFDVVTEGGGCSWYECDVYTNQKQLELILGLVEVQNLEFRFGGNGQTFSVNYLELTLLYKAATNPAYYSGLGNTLHLKGKQNEASLAYRISTEINLASGNSEKALVYYQKALKCQPQRIITKAYLELGLTLVEKGLLNQLLAVCDSAFKGHHNSVLFYYSLAILLEEQGLTDEAHTLFQHAPQCKLSHAEICEYIWKGLNQLGPLDENSIYCKTEINPEAVYAHFKQASLSRIMAMATLTDEDIFFLENSGLSVVNLKLMMLDSIALEEFHINSLSESEKKVELANKSIRKNGGKTFTWGEMNHKNNFQQTIVETGYIYTLCPFSGRVLKSNHCQIFLGGIFYRFEGNQIFYLFAHSWSGALYGVYFPAIETVILLKSGFQRDILSLINYLKEDTVSNWKLIKASRQNTNPKKIAAILGIAWANLGHYLWNEVTGVNFLYEASILENVDKFCVVFEGNNVYKDFNIVDIFPEIPTEKLIMFSDSKSCSKFLLDNNYLGVRVTDVFIKEELAIRIYSNAIKKCSKSFLKEVENSKKQFPLIWVNLRSHNKSWISQTQGYANIINKLYKDYPKIGVVFDGSPSEEVIMDQIVDLIPSAITTYNAIGDVYESIVWAHAIDTYIAVVGSGLTLVTWIANKPGVTHSEIAHLEQQFFWSEVRENSLPPVFINKEHIVEVGQGIYGRMYCNYDLDDNVIYNEVVKIVNSLTESKSFT